MKLADQNGFTVTGLLVLLPLFVSLITLFAAAMSLLAADAELKHECRTTLLRAQDSIAADLEELMKLNETAQALRTARAKAELAVVAAVAPPAVAAAKAALTAIKIRQSFFAARQLTIIARAKAKSRSTPLKTKLKLHRDLRERSRLLDGKSANLEARLEEASFHVVATPENSLTPDYHPAPGFSESQRMSVDATWSVSALLPDWLARLLGRTDLEMKTTCRATIEKGRNGWRSRLKADKS